MIVVGAVVFLSDRRRGKFFVFALLFAELLVVLVPGPVRWRFPRRRPYATVVEVGESGVWPGKVVESASGDIGGERCLLADRLL